MSKTKRLSDLTPDASNANKGTAKGQKMIVGSIQRNRFGRSIILDKHGNIIGGNKTIEAAAEVLGVDAEVLVIETDGSRIIAHQRTDLDLTDPDPNNPARRLAYEDNTTSQFSFGLDVERVVADMEAGFDFAGIDLSLPDLETLLGDDAGQLKPGKGPGDDTEPQVNQAEQLRQQWGTEAGQVWQLGRHRVVCGDCTDPAVVEAVMRGEKIDMLLSDPPYASGGLHSGARRQSTNKKYKRSQTKRDYLDFSGDQRDQRSWMYWCTSWLSEFRKIADKEAYIAIFVDWRQLPTLTDCVQASSWLWRGVCVWDKTEGARMPHMGYFRQQAEYVVWGTYSDLQADYDRDEALPGVFRSAVDQDKMHLTQKPIEVLEWLIKISLKKNIFDPFLGSGTTLIAAENLGHTCYGCEIDPGYTAVILQRYRDHTGIEPELVDKSDSIKRDK